MSNALKIAGAFLLGVACLVGIVMGGSALSLWQFQVFGARTESVRNDVFKHSTAHVEGSIRTLRRYQIEYGQTTDEGTRHAIAAMVIREADNANEDEMPDDLVRFIEERRSGK